MVRGLYRNFTADQLIKKFTATASCYDPVQSSPHPRTLILKRFNFIFNHTRIYAILEVFRVQVCMRLPPLLPGFNQRNNITWRELIMNPLTMSFCHFIVLSFIRCPNILLSNILSRLE